MNTCPADDVKWRHWQRRLLIHAALSTNQRSLLRLLMDYLVYFRVWLFFLFTLTVLHKQFIFLKIKNYVQRPNEICFYLFLFFSQFRASQIASLEHTISHLIVVLSRVRAKSFK